MFWLLVFMAYIVGLFLFFMVSMIANWDIMVEDYEKHRGLKTVWKTFGVLVFGWLIGYLMSISIGISFVCGFICDLFQFE